MNHHEELKPDPLIGAALRWVEGEVPLEEVDWAEMRSNIRQRASLPLARRRALQVASPRWVKPLIPLAAAAGLATVFWLGIGREDSSLPASTPVAVATPVSIQEALLSDVSDQEFRLLVADRDADELLMIAASQR
ncbi:MAG TPA: hypothetical protein VF167_17525 [Longimicrobiaceae bacterium]